MKLVSTATAVLLLVLAASAPAHAQLTGSLNGLHDHHRDQPEGDGG